MRRRVTYCRDEHGETHGSGSLPFYLRIGPVSETDSLLSFACNISGKHGTLLIRGQLARSPRSSTSPRIHEYTSHARP